MPNGVDSVLVLWDRHGCDCKSCQLGGSPIRCGDHPDATFMSGNGMFPLRGGFAVDGNYSPIIFQGFGLNVSADQHRFDSEDHARLNAGPTHTRTQGKNIWRLMHGCANTVANVVVYNARWCTILGSNVVCSRV